jgi:ABC transporter substrate binding protein
MNRREFIAGLGGAVAWPLAARAQQPERMRRVGVLMTLDENDPEPKARLSAFTQALADLGWNDGRNVRMDLRWAGSDTNRMQALAQELVRLQPDIIVATSTPATVAVQRETRTIPIVFVAPGDEVVAPLPRHLSVRSPGDRVNGLTTKAKRNHIVTELDPIDDAALEIQEEFNALIQGDSRDVVVRAVTGILATTAYAGSNSPVEACELVNAIAAEARQAIDDMHEVEKARKRGTHSPD